MMGYIEDGDGLPPGLTVRHLTLLREIGRSASLSEAGDVLGLAQSTVSQAVARIEALAGMPLFERDGNRRVPTPTGERLIEVAGQLVGDLERAWADLRAGDRRPLRVGVIDAVTLYLARDRTAAFGAAHPDIDLRLVVDGSEVLMERLRARELDVAVVVGPEDDLPAIPVATEMLHLYGRADDASPCVLYPEGSRTRALIDRGLARLGIRPEVVATAGNPAVLRELARLGVGWTVLPTGVAEASGVETPEPVGPLVAERPVVAVRRSVGTDVLADAFVEAVREPARRRGTRP